MKTSPRSPGLLWETWTRIPGRRVLLVDAVRDRSWTAQELTEESLRFSEFFAQQTAGTKIAFRLPNGVEWLSLFLALQRAGLAAVPLDASLPNEGCLDVARRIGAHALYLEGEFHTLKADPVRNKKCCCVKLTSGSDGHPKSVECQARHLLADGAQIIETMKIRPGDRNLAVIPLGHSYGLGNLVMPLILQGTAMVCAADYVPRQLVEWIERYRVTVFPGVPALYRVLAALPRSPGLASLRTGISAGAVLNPAVAAAFFERHEIKIHNFYGSSETGGISYDRTGAASLSGESVGRPLNGVSILFRKGQIEVKSPAVAMPGGRWRLNDGGAWNQRGELMLLGRLGQDANIGGKKVHPLEVERALRALPGVVDAVVWIHQSQGREVLAAGVETKLSRARLESALAESLSAWKLPKFYFLSAELPRTARGKIDLPGLRKRIAA